LQVKKFYQNKIATMIIKINVSLSTINFLEHQIEQCNKQLLALQSLNMEHIDASLFNQRFYTNHQKQQAITSVKNQYQGQLDLLLQCIPLHQCWSESGINHIADHTNQKIYITNQFA
jgi:RNA binding exosome subunit